ncbi:MAG TPA: hypothetical protein VN726_12955 [Hanamia sp.]|nr:hypothetical protein [Hanamia sp.]
MDKDLQNIENLFKKELEENEEFPSPQVWTEIENVLNEENPVILKRYKPQKKIIFLLVFLFVASSIYVWRNNSTTKGNLEKETVAKNMLLSKSKTGSNPQKTDNPAGPEEENKQILRENNNAQETVKSNVKPVADSAFSKQILKPGKPFTPAPSTASNQLPAKKVKIKTNTSKEKSFATDNGQENVREPFQSPNQLYFISINDFINKAAILNQVYNLSPFNSSLQTNSAINNNKSLKLRTPASLNHSRFSATIFFSPDIPFSQLSDEDRNSGNNLSRELEKNESGSFSSSFGFFIDYQLNQKFSLESGINHSTINIKGEPEIIYAEPDNSGKVKYRINTSSGKAYVLPYFSTNPNIGDSLFTKSINHSLRYFEIPLALKFNIIKRNFLINVKAGVSANMLMHGKIATEVEKGNESEPENIHEIDGLMPVYFSGLAGIGLTFKVYKNVSFSFSPTIKFALNSINRDVPVKSFPGTIGFHVGLETKL